MSKDVSHWTNMKAIRKIRRSLYDDKLVSTDLKKKTTFPDAG